MHHASTAAKGEVSNVARLPTMIHPTIHPKCHQDHHPSVCLSNLRDGIRSREVPASPRSPGLAQTGNCMQPTMAFCFSSPLAAGDWRVLECQQGARCFLLPRVFSRAPRARMRRRTGPKSQRSSPAKLALPRTRLSQKQARDSYASPCYLPRLITLLRGLGAHQIRGTEGRTTSLSHAFQHVGEPRQFFG